MDKINEFKLGEKIIGISGILLFLDSFLTWFDFAGYGAENGWSNFLSLLAILIGIAMVVLLVLQAFTDVQLPETLGPLTHPQLYTIAGGLAFVLVLIQLLVGSSVGGFGVTVDLDRAFGLYLGVIFSAGLAAGGFMLMQGIGDSEAPGGGAAGGTPPPPPPPSA